MNREIKFRAFEIDWYNKNLKQNQGRMIQWEDIRDDFASIQNKTSYFILMQYTGLKDKNGKEIYEGDIARQFFTEDEKVMKCVWKKTGYVWEGEDDGVSGNWSGQDFEIIGNIYENPELSTNKD